MSMQQHTNGGRERTEPEWVEQFCLSPWCRAEHWYVRSDQRSKDLWLITESPEMAPWSVCAGEAVCPLCGEALAAHVEGVGELEDERPNAIIDFIRKLGQAAA